MARFARTLDALLSAKRSKGGDSLSCAKFSWLMARRRELKVCGARCSPFADLAQECGHARHAPGRLSGLCRPNQPVGLCNAVAECRATSALRNDRLRYPNVALSEPAVIEVNG